MAKARSGLGRGLDSLLGGGLDAGLGDQKELPVSKPAADETSSKSDGEKEKALEEMEAADASSSSDEDIYVKEDNVTIKGVVERTVSNPQKVPAVPQVSPRKSAVPQSVTELDIDLVEPNPNQPRTSFKKEELEELAQSIKKNGLLQPILVRKVGDKYQIIAGERRWQACKSIDLKKVPVRIKEADDDETIVLALIENIQRSDLNPIEEAYGYKRMMERGKMTQSEVAQAVSKGRSTIANALRLLELPVEAQQLLFEEKITAGHARAILSIPTKEGRRKLTDKLIEQHLSVRDAERIAKQLSGKKEKAPVKEKPQAPKTYKTVARALSDSLGTEVKIKSSQGKNRIEVVFKDEADLERLFRIIASGK